MKSAAIIAAIVLVCAFIAWRVFRTPSNLADPPPIFTVGALYEGTRAIYESGLLPIDVTGTGSMQPHIPAHPLGAGVVMAVAGLDRTSFEALVEGDFVVYRAGSKRLIHRLGERSVRGFVVYGTNNDVSDSAYVTASNYVGRVAVVYRLP